MSKYRISMNGKIYEMEIELVEDQAEIMHPVYEVPDVSFKREVTVNPVVQVIDPSVRKKTIRNENRVESLMPGTVIKVSAEAGETVEKGQAVITLEAMKMENEIIAPKTGVVKGIFVKEGQTVPGKYLLFEME
jgi:biotin carboxyl carrier protein